MKKTGCGSFLFLIILIGVIRSFSSIKGCSETSAVNEIDERVDMSEYEDGYEYEEGKSYGRTFSWSFVDASFQTRDCSITLTLLSDDIAAALKYLDVLGEKSEEELGIRQNSSYDEMDYNLAYWKSVFGRVYAEAYDRFDGIVNGFRTIFKKNRISPEDQVSFLISFVQNIRYERPGGKFDLLPPMAVLDKKFGDCDTKALLLYIILEKLNIDCVLFWSLYYEHAMLGVSVTATGDFKSLNGTRYYFVETTYPGWVIGQLPPQTSEVRYWYAIDVDKYARSNNSTFKNERARDLQDEDINRQNPKAQPDAETRRSRQH